MFVTYSTLAQASALAPQESPTTFSVVVIGFLFVVIVLALLAAITSAIGAFFIRSAAVEAKNAAVAAQKAAEASGSRGPASGAAASQASAAQGEDDPAIMAVVAAAVHTVLGDRPHRVVSVRTSGPGWAQEGRRQIFSSHRVR